MMKHKIMIFTIIVGMIVFLFASCSSIKVTGDYDKTVNFSQYESYEFFGWAEESDQLMNDFDKRRIQSAFANEFAKRGLEYKPLGGGDLVVTLFIVIDQKTEQRANTTYMGGGYGEYGGYYGGYYGYGPGWGWGPSYSTTTVSTYDYEVGTLVCDVYDKKEERLIWEGIGRGTVDENSSTRDKGIPKAVAAIMATYPVPPLEENN